MTTDCNNSDITIVGGGMVGAAIAGLLVAVNPQWRINVIEAFPLPKGGSKAYQPSFDDRSTAIAAGSVTLLKRMGVWETLREKAAPIKQVHVSDKGHIGGALIDHSEAGVDALGYVIPNAWIGRVLLAHLQTLPQVNLILPATVEQLTPVAGGARICLREQGQDSTTFDTQLAIIADGADSPLRQQLGIDARVHDYQQTAIIANISLEEAHRGVAYERFTDEGPMALLPLLGSTGDNGGHDSKRAALVWTQPRDQAAEILALSDEAFLAQLQQRFGFRLGYFNGVGQRDSYPLQLSVATEQVRSGIAVMGNAAHFLHPVAGQGFNLAIRDSAMLCDVLLQAQKDQQPLGSIRVLQRYVEEQSFDQFATIHFSDQITKLFSTPALPAAALRAMGFLGLEFLPMTKQWLVKQTMGAMGKSSLSAQSRVGGAE